MTTNLVPTVLALVLVAPLLPAQEDDGSASRPAAEGVLVAPPLHGLAWLPGARLALNDDEGLRVVDPASGEVFALPGVYPGPPATARDADVVAALDDRGDVVVWDARDLIPLEVLPLSDVEAFAGVAPADVRLEVADDGAAVVARAGDAAVELRVAEPDGVHPAPAPAAAGRVAAARVERAALTWTPAPSEGEPWTRPLEAAPAFVALSPDGEWLAHGAAGAVQRELVRRATAHPALDAGGRLEGLAFDHVGRILALARDEGPDGPVRSLRVWTPADGRLVQEVALDPGPAEARLASAAGAPVLAVAYVDARVDVLDLKSFEVTWTLPIVTEPDLVGEVFRRDVLGLSPDGALLSLTGEGGLALIATTSPGFFNPPSVRLPRDAGLPYSVRFDASASEIVVGCRGVSPQEPALEWRASLPEGNFAVGWRPTAHDPGRHPYAWSADEATRLEVLVEEEWRVERAADADGEGGWSRLVGPRAVLVAAASADAGAVAVVLDGDRRVRFVDLATGADLVPGEDG